MNDDETMQQKQTKKQLINVIHFVRQNSLECLQSKQIAKQQQKSESQLLEHLPSNSTAYWCAHVKRINVTDTIVYQSKHSFLGKYGIPLYIVFTTPLYGCVAYGVLWLAFLRLYFVIYIRIFQSRGKRHSQLAQILCVASSETTTTTIMIVNPPVSLVYGYVCIHNTAQYIETFDHVPMQAWIHIHKTNTQTIF